MDNIGSNESSPDGIKAASAYMLRFLLFIKCLYYYKASRDKYYAINFKK